MKNKFNLPISPPHNTNPPDPLTIPPLPTVPLPISFSDSQPLPGVALDTQSLLRDLLEAKFKPTVLRKL